MAAGAVPPGPTAPPDAVAVFRGNLLPLMRALGYTSTEQYHTVKHALLAMDCARQLARGARFKLGCWALIRPPTVALWNQRVRRPFTYKREAAVQANHRRAVRAFLLDLARGQGHPELIGEAVLAGCATVGEIVQYVLRLPEARQRALFAAGEVCLAEFGAPHICGVSGLDPLAPSHAAGAWKRVPEYTARLQAEGA
jgi:hypothetical protein